jgi:leucyl aminopeptidase
MRTAITPILLLLSLVSASVLHPPPSQNQQVLWSGNDVEVTEATIKRLLAVHNDDPVQVMRLVDPGYASTLDEPRLLQVFGAEPAWMTEGDKLRLKKQGLSFMDLTGRQDVSRSTEKQTGMFCRARSIRPQYENNSITVPVTAEWPEVRYQTKVHEIVQSLKMEEMVYNLGNLTSFFNRYYRSESGVQSSRWIYDKLLEVGSSSVSPGLGFAFSPRGRLSQTRLPAFIYLSRRLPTRSPNTA